MPHRTPKSNSPGRPPASVHTRSTGSRSAPPVVSGRWLLAAASLAMGAAAACCWLTLCLLFWQGSWQLLYHPRSSVTQTPATGIGLPFDSIGFAATAAGTPQLHGWWIPGDFSSRYTAIYLHGADGNLGDIANALIPLHAAHLNIFAFDYRGYGASVFQHPSEARWHQDAESAIHYLLETRHIPAGSLVLYGQGLGANLALEVAAAHPDLAGVVLDAPIDNPTSAIFNDPRAKLVPARLLVRDRWNADAAAANVLIPSLWIMRTPANSPPRSALESAYSMVHARKEQLWLPQSPDAERQFLPALSAWLDNLPNRKSTP